MFFQESVIPKFFRVAFIHMITSVTMNKRNEILNIGTNIDALSAMS